MTQGNLSIEDYGKKMKITADAFHDIGQPVSEATLVLNLLHDINPRFSNTADFIASQKDTTFTTTLYYLLMKELRLANEDRFTAAIALIASSPSASCGFTCCSSSMPLGTQQ